MLGQDYGASKGDVTTVLRFTPFFHYRDVKNKQKTFSSDLFGAAYRTIHSVAD